MLHPFEVQKIDQCRWNSIKVSFYILPNIQLYLYCVFGSDFRADEYYWDGNSGYSDSNMDRLFVRDVQIIQTEIKI